MMIANLIKKLNLFPLIIIFSLFLILIIGCSKSNNVVVCSSVPENEQSSCCAEQNKDSLKIDCIGHWENSVDYGCSFVCDSIPLNDEIKVTEQKSCVIDADCACGRNIETNDCFIGNKQYVDISSQCPDYCTGIAGNLEIKCQYNICTQVTFN